ncbi:MULTISPECIES: hypothetical protein [Sinomonas]|jgi:hypothetical protein|uniref:hypothetical protein n=1 Tax=Sinomonas TaxID=596707 RepID=UPI0011099818|nr:hypothetical protein [Sinomonas gamaensis]HKU10374.1 hypothetical protein [Sinomonas sp.]
MTVVFSIVVFLHIVGAAMIVGPWIASMKSPTVGARQFDGAMTQLVTGIILAGLLPVMVNTVPNWPAPDYPKLIVKFIVAVVVGALAFVGNRRRKAGEPVAPGLAHAVGGLALLNVAIATIWP